MRDDPITLVTIAPASERMVWAIRTYDRQRDHSFRARPAATNLIGPSRSVSKPNEMGIKEVTAGYKRPQRSGPGAYPLRDGETGLLITC